MTRKRGEGCRFMIASFINSGLGYSTCVANLSVVCLSHVQRLPEPGESERETERKREKEKERYTHTQTERGERDR